MSVRPPLPSTPPPPTVAAKPPSPGTPTNMVDIPSLAFHINMLQLSLFAFYVALTLPRAIVRLLQPAEIFNGFFLRSGAQHTTPWRSDSVRTLLRADTLGRSNTVTTLKGHDNVKKDHDDAPPVPYSASAHATLDEENNVTGDFRALVTPIANRARGIQQGYVPTRVPRWTTIIHPSLANALNFRVSTGFSFGKLLVLLTYALIVLYACLYRSNPLVDPNRETYIAVSQIPIVVALANKSNWLSWMSGVSYNKLNYFHRFAGTVVIIAANVHALGHIYKAALMGQLQAILHIPLLTWGLVSICTVDILFVCALCFRGRLYSLFFISHITCVTVALYAIHKHCAPVLPYLITAVVLYAVDHAVRLARTRYTTAWLTAESELNGGTTLVNVPSLDAGWRAGQHVRIRVIGDTWFDWYKTWIFGRARPFTIASASNTGGMLLAIRARGAWTRKLLRMATADDATEKPTEPELGSEPGRAVRIIVEGPYGGPGYTLYTAYSGVVLVAGGSGISYVTGVLHHILQKHAAGRSNVRVIEVVWSVADPDSLYSLLPILGPIMRPRASPRASLSIRFSVHWTRTFAHAPQVPRATLPPGMYLRAGRPDIHATLQSMIDSLRDAYSMSECCKCSGSSPSGIVIGTCGPTALIDASVRAVNNVSWADWIDMGGVESVEELFGW